MKTRFFSIFLTLAMLVFFAGATNFAQGGQDQKKNVKIEKKVDQKKDMGKTKTTAHKKHSKKKGTTVKK